MTCDRRRSSKDLDARQRKWVTVINDVGDTTWHMKKSRCHKPLRVENVEMLWFGT